MKTIAIMSVCLSLLAAAPARAQQPPKADRIPVFVFDARGAYGMLKESESTAKTFGAAPEALPRRGIGLVGGLHLYPLRRGQFAFGVGGELLLIRAQRQEKDAQGMPVGIAIRRRFESLSGQISLNFGHRNGWSYLSAGMGPLNFDTYLDGDVPDGLRTPTLNYGAGARWFNSDHAAFSVDMRFYATSPANPTLIVGERERQTILVLSAGIAIK